MHEVKEREINYERIQIKRDLVPENGEIPKTWLKQYKDFFSWQDLFHDCLHCHKQFKSLKALLKHFDDANIGVSKRSIKCSRCPKIFKDNLYLVSYINHMAKNEKDHYPHLKFACILCQKVYANVPKLCEHLISEHGTTSVKLYPCFDCGLVCSNLTRLTEHKTSHEM